MLMLMLVACSAVLLLSLINSVSLWRSWQRIKRRRLDNSNIYYD